MKNDMCYFMRDCETTTYFRMILIYENIKTTWTTIIPSNHPRKIGRPIRNFIYFYS